MLKARIYTNEKGLLVFDGFICKDGVVSGGDNLRNDLFLAFIKAVREYPDKIAGVGVFNCNFLTDDWMSRAMNEWMKYRNVSIEGGQGGQ